MFNALCPHVEEKNVWKNVLTTFRSENHSPSLPDLLSSLAGQSDSYFLHHCVPLSFQETDRHPQEARAEPEGRRVLPPRVRVPESPLQRCRSGEAAVPAGERVATDLHGGGEEGGHRPEETAAGTYQDCFNVFVKPGN